MNENKKIYTTAIISKILLIGMSIATSALINRKLGVALKGEYAYLTNIVSVAVILLSFGLGQTYSTYRRKFGNDVLGNFIFWSVLHSVFAGIIAIFFLAIKRYDFAIVSFLSGSGLLKTNILYYAGIEDIKKRDLKNIAYKCIYLILILIVYIFCNPSLYLLLGITLIEDIIIIAATCYFYKFRLKIKTSNSIKIIEVYRLGFLCMIMHMLMSLNYSIDIFFLKQMATSSMVGLYSVGVTLANMLWLIPDSLKDVIVNKTSREDSINEIVKVTKYSIYFSCCLIIGFILFGKHLIIFLYGSEFVDSYICTTILFMGCLSMIIYKLIHPIYIAKGKQWVVVKILSLSVITNILSNIILIPLFNIYGAAIASVISYSVCSFVFLYIFCKEYKVKIKEFFIINKEDKEFFKKLIPRIKTGKK